MARVAETFRIRDLKLPPPILHLIHSQISSSAASLSNMYLLRRTAARALSFTPSKSFVVKPRSITTYTSAFQARQQGWIPSKFQRRYASDEAAKTESAESAAAAAEELAQTKPEAPIEENLTPLQQNAQHEPTDAFATVTADTSSVPDRPEGLRSRRRPQRDPVTPGSILYVGNLFYEVGEDQLKRIFSRFGNIKSVKIVRDAQQMSKGFGYVEYETVDDARAAIENLDMQVFEGRTLVVQYHRVKSNVLSPRQSKVPHPPSKTIFIGNMAFEMSDKDLNDMFRDIRNVTDVRVAIDRRTGQPRGFAHADFVDVASAQRAMDQLKGQSFYGRTITLDFSETPNRDRRKREVSNAEQSSSNAEQSSSNTE